MLAYVSGLVLVCRLVLVVAYWRVPLIRWLTLLP